MTTSTFDPQRFLANVGEKLVLEFAHAGQGTTPTLAGDSREHPARLALERMLPPSAGVGSGIVVDCAGNASKQQDIIIYDRAVTPIFSINNNPSATYYPTEGVIAVGEVKTAVGKPELEDAFAKIDSVHGLERCVGPNTAVFRPYGLPMSVHGAPEENFDQQHKATDHIFGFLLCQDILTSMDTIVSNATTFWEQQHGPGLGAIAVLKHGIVQPMFNRGRVVSVRDADSVYFDADTTSVFARLLEVISWVVRNGRTVSIDAFDHYLAARAANAAEGSKTVPFDGQRG